MALVVIATRMTFSSSIHSAFALWHQRVKLLAWASLALMLLNGCAWFRMTRPITIPDPARECKPGEVRQMRSCMRGKWCVGCYAQ